jgi:ABC-type polysaccharide/polyol phosphate export permease
MWRFWMSLSSLRGACHYLYTLWEYRYFWLSLVKADIHRRYRRSALGVCWSLLNPILMTATLCVVYRHVFNVPATEFGPFLLTGLAFWGFFSSAVLQGCGCFYAAESYIRQAPAPLAIYPLRSVLSQGVHFTIALLTALLFSWGLHGPTRLAVAACLVPTLLLLFLLAWSVTTLMAFVNVYFPDVQHLSEAGLQVLFFLTPIVYPPRILAAKGWAILLQYSPLATLVQLLRLSLLPGADAGVSAGQLLILTGSVALAAVLAVYALARFERKVIFRL